ncbi:hypothetical protein ACFYW6_33960 [Streptomyces sp. NPDC002659]|uniref:hypothetical protein n=1 Tax=Streptomyces sp. NPDC002659 TaxID=3364656 RepID=UPI0036740A07
MVRTGLAAGAGVGAAITVLLATVNVGAADSAGSAQGQLSTDDIRVLLFGAAWKVLDQLVEFALEGAGVRPDRGQRYEIGEKARKAQGGSVAPVPPFDNRPDVWTRVMKVYASTAELRNSFTHRKLSVKQGVMQGVSKSGTLTKQLTSDEQSAFCQVAVGVGEAVIEESLPTRRADQLSWALDQLTSHHAQPLFGATAAQGLIPLVIVRRSPNELTIDFHRIHQRARAAVSGVSHYDLEIHLPDGRVLAAPLEDVPEEEISFSVDTPPDWLHPA